MSLVKLLKAARHLVRSSWAPEALHHGACLTCNGNPCDYAAEYAESFSVVGAIACMAGERYPLDSPRTDEALRALERIACPMYVANEERRDPPLEQMTPEQLREALTAMKLAGDGPLSAWLEAPDRTLLEVISVFDRAIQRERFLAENGR